jgi:prevent-host-death family protein
MGIFEAKQKLSELVERASRGERIRITRRGKVAAEIGPAQSEAADLAEIKQIFANIDKIRRRAKPLPLGVTVKDLIEEGRR